MAAPFIPPVLPGGGLAEDEHREEHHGQLRFAERFANTYGGRFLFAHGIGWHEWDGCRWAECKDGAEVERSSPGQQASVSTRRCSQNPTASHDVTSQV